MLSIRRKTRQKNAILKRVCGMFLPAEKRKKLPSPTGYVALWS